MSTKRGRELCELARAHAAELSALTFRATSWVYNPLEYAWEAHQEYLLKYVGRSTRVLFLGMNPGPWGMVQTGVPFGEVAAVRGFLKIDEQVGRPKCEHPKRPIEGMECEKSEVSGRRLWGFFEKEFGSAKAFFREHFVGNYCALAFMEEGGKNLTPDKLPAQDRVRLEALCDGYLRGMIGILDPEWLVGVGGFAEEALRRCVEEGLDRKVGRILHPSPASPAANRDWEGTARKQLQEQGIWESGARHGELK